MIFDKKFLFFVFVILWSITSLYACVKDEKARLESIAFANRPTFGTIGVLVGENGQIWSGVLIAPQTVLTTAHSAHQMQGCKVIFINQSSVSIPVDFSEENGQTKLKSNFNELLKTLPQDCSSLVTEHILHPDTQVEPIPLLYFEENLEEPDNIQKLVQHYRKDFEFLGRDQEIVNNVIDSGKEHFMITGPDLCVIKLDTPIEGKYLPLIDQLPAESVAAYSAGYGMTHTIQETPTASAVRFITAISRTKGRMLYQRHALQHIVEYSPKAQKLSSALLSWGGVDDTFIPEEGMHPLTGLITGGDSGGALITSVGNGTFGILGISTFVARSKVVERCNSLLEQVADLPEAYRAIQQLKEELEKTQRPVYNVFTPVTPYVDWIRSVM